MKFFKIFLLLAVSISIFISLFSCKHENTDGLRFGYPSEPRTLDPLSTSGTADGRSILFNVFEGLVKPNAEGVLMPCIAESWTIEQDGLVYIFQIKNDIYFHNGNLLTPLDVKFTLETGRDAGMDGLRDISDVTITGEHEIKITLKTLDPEFLPYLTVGIVENNNNDREKNINGTGPFKIESYTPLNNLVLVKFDKYWQKGLPHLDKITITFFSNFDSLILSLTSDNIDGAFLTGDMAAKLDHRQFDVFNNRSAGVNLIALNNAEKPLDDVRVRRAINYGINVKEIIDTAFFGSGIPSSSPVIPGLPVYYDGSLSYYDDSVFYPYNPDLARELLSEAGFNDSNRLSLEITVPSNYTMHVNTAQVVVQQLLNIGINATIKLVDFESTWLKEVYRNRNYQATIISLDSTTVSPRGFLARYNSQSSGNFINFNNAEYDRVYNSIKTELDGNKRINLYKEAQRIISENAASVYLQDIVYFMTFRKNKYAGTLDYPLYVIDFSTIYRKNEN